MREVAASIAFYDHVEAMDYIGAHQYQPVELSGNQRVYALIKGVAMR
jgi:hypothetical protein